MCCSMKATVFWLSSIHMWYALTQAVIQIQLIVQAIETNLAACLLAIIYSSIFFVSGFLIFRGADQDSTALVGTGSTTLVLIIIKRYFVMYYGFLLKPTLPEGDFLNPYGTTIPVIFTVLLYLFYLSILFCYHNELKFSPPADGKNACFTPLSCRRQQFPQTPSMSLSLNSQMQQHGK